MAAQFSFFDIIWTIFIISAFLPMLKQQHLEMQRMRLIRAIEQKRRSRLITMIHRQELLSLLGLPLTRYINIEDSEHILRAIRYTPPDMPIDLLLHTPGGLVLAAEQIARALEKHPAKVTVFIPHYAMSGGTMIALAADEIVMDENAVLGPVDPQLGNYPAASILETVRLKGIEKVDDTTVILADISRKAINQVEEFVHYLLRGKMGSEKARAIAHFLTSGRFTHDYPITSEQLKLLGLPVRTDLPKEIYSLMELYPQPSQRRPSVQYIPLPYGRPDRDGKR
ncbi:ClpP class serine protease [Thermodesulfitimonas autotrophica]|jgi:ClpP class serine protease|uniref:ClpP class serine protease n=1 Tax=Thermodesulfitimonas autotrophica TaxID=1894989 RepID=A0A3N5ADY6_9THEO|nr:ATP-dependent Clp protease proteolytic subunit [Thermodesulfitimonas autotrophica]RPF42854.1 ClpP class serine protease [Thermodesulfitimonas autotrophica]